MLWIVVFVGNPGTKKYSCCSTLSIITRARSLDNVPATNTGVWNVLSSRLEKTKETKHTFALSDEVTKITKVVLRKFSIKHYKVHFLCS